MEFCGQDVCRVAVFCLNVGTVALILRFFALGTIICLGGLFVWLDFLAGIIKMGNPPALPGDSQSLTVPGVGSILPLQLVVEIECDLEFGSAS